MHCLAPLAFTLLKAEMLQTIWPDQCHTGVLPIHSVVTQLRVWWPPAPASVHPCERLHASTNHEQGACLVADHVPTTKNRLVESYPEKKHSCRLSWLSIGLSEQPVMECIVCDPAARPVTSPDHLVLRCRSAALQRTTSPPITPSCIILEHWQQLAWQPWEYSWYSCTHQMALTSKMPLLRQLPLVTSVNLTTFLAVHRDLLRLQLQPSRRRAPWKMPSRLWLPRQKKW